MFEGEASNPLRTWEFGGSAYYYEWPKVADAVIEAGFVALIMAPATPADDVPGSRTHCLEEIVVVGSRPPCLVAESGRRGDRSRIRYNKVAALYMPKCHITKNGQEPINRQNLQSWGPFFKRIARRHERMP